MIKGVKNFNKCLFLAVFGVISLCVLLDFKRIDYCNTYYTPTQKTEQVENIQGTEVPIYEIEQNYTIKDAENIESESSTQDFSEYQTELFDIINTYREQQGLYKYRWSYELKESADIRAKEASEYWSHTRPDGSAFNTVDFNSYGENLARRYTEPSEIFEAWKNSETHNENLLDDEFVSCYISFYQDESTNIIYCAIEFSYY